MATNTQIVASLGWTDAPPDLACIPGDLNQLGRVMAQFFNVNSVTSELDTGSQNSIAQQALEQSAIALATAQQALAAQPNTRSSGNDPIAIQPGNSILTIPLSPVMPDTNYIVLGCYYAPDTPIGTYYNWHVITGTQQVGSCTIRFDNTPDNTKFAYIVRSLTQ